MSLRHAPFDRYPEFRRHIRETTIRTRVGPARAVIYAPEVTEPAPPAYLNFHGSGFVLPMMEWDDPLCRYLAAEAGVFVINVDYALAPQHPFPAPPRQAFEILQWVSTRAEEYGWDENRIAVGGQSAGGNLAAAVARQVLERGGPGVALQVLHYPVLDLGVRSAHKHSVIANPRLRGWMGDIFDNSYVPDPEQRADRLVSPANPADTADLNGIAPALVVTAEFDILRAEGERYAKRLREADALVEHHDVPQADHGYDFDNAAKARDVYALIAHHVKENTKRPR
jgi:acetyl esterase